MAKFLNLQPEIFGVDINDVSLRIVKLRKKRKHFRLVSANDIKIDPGIIQDGMVQDFDALTKIIKNAVVGVKGQKLGTNYIIASLPEEKSFSRVIQMPKMPFEDLKQAVPYEAENYIPLTIDKVYLDFQLIHSHAEKKANHLDLLINVMPKAIIDKYVACFKKAGLKPCILEVESQALVRSLLKNGQSDSSILFIDLGGANTTFIIYSENSVRFTSSVPIASIQLTQAIASTGISFEEAEEKKIRYGLDPEGDPLVVEAMTPLLFELTKHIKRYMAFYHDHVSQEYASNDGNIEKVILSGGGANLKKLPEFLANELGMPVELGNPLVNIAFNKKTDSKLIPEHRVLSFTTALGLAIRGAMDLES